MATATSPLGARPTTAPKCTDSSQPLRLVIAIGANVSGFAIGTACCDSAFSAGHVSYGRDAGEVAVDHFVMFTEIADDSLSHGRCRNRQYRADRTEHGSAGNCRPEGDRWV